MKVFAEKLVNTEVDRNCDVCGESVMVECGGHKYAEFGELSASFGYGSTEDGKVYHLDLCESCFKTALYALRDHRRVTAMFDDDENLPDETFGLDLERTTHI